MNKKKWVKNILTIGFMVLTVAIIPMLKAKATEVEAAEQVMNRLGRTTARVNVRYGPGDGLYDVIVHNGEKITLDENKEVLIVDDAIYEASGNVWYNIIFQWNGEELNGWATSSYITVIANVTRPRPRVRPRNRQRRPQVRNRPRVRHRLRFRQHRHRCRQSTQAAVISVLFGEQLQRW